MLLIFILITIFLTSFIISNLVCRFVIRRPMLDNAASERHKTHVGSMPTGGGIGIWLGVLIPTVVGCVGLVVIKMFPSLQEFLPEFIRVHVPGLWYRLDQLAVLITVGSVLAIVGTIDDKFKLSWKLRLALQSLAAIVVVSYGFRFTIFIDWQAAAFVLNVLWIVALTNSFNMLDNMDGLSGGVAAICSAFLIAVMLIAPQATGAQLFIASFLTLLFGALAGFLTFNNPFRTSLFMGDGGAYFIGFTIASLTTVATYYEQTGIPKPQLIFVPILILAVPIYDTITVVSVRICEARSPFAGDKSHFSHRLVAKGLSRRNAVLTIYLTTTVCSLGSLLLYQVNFFGAVVIAVQTLLLLVLVGVLELRD
ncbi:MAG: undecaprenyl/decaprenyl-phosphate alpha-N-acetylglucosaminyl 1-phosphate transferase [Planctomycetaceae bacterium]|jgi:UDP-GlcNAc:undecaprenyl-phosphate GlcNAc-1-phosphate transferase|nr:undecaprenyl/decaprenyl-phosphate alpha-N-acetylglucosaminyl 1-phosphate transferase [Planctomycetaceae bacterium]